LDDLTAAIIEGVVQTIAAVPDEPYLQVLLDEPSHTLLRSVTSDTARDIGRTVLVESTSINWSDLGPASEAFDELIEWALRIVQSFLTNPGQPPRTPEQLRAHLRRWLGPAIREWTEMRLPKPRPNWNAHGH
jgi:hypothetical protein